MLTSQPQRGLSSEYIPAGRVIVDGDSGDGDS